MIEIKMLDQPHAVFRRAAVADIPAMSVIRLSVKENVLSNPGRVTGQMYEDYLEKDGRGWVAEQNDVIVAFSYADKNDGSIWALFVSPDHEGKGLATHLLKLAVDWLFGLGHQHITLHTSPGTRADRFYARQGWRRGSIQGKQVEYILKQSYPEHHLVKSIEQLTKLFDQVAPASYVKQVSFIHPHYRAMIEASPFAVLATSGPNGLDASPRGDSPGFVVVEDERTILLPERRGNNRADSLHNIISDPGVALLFLIPGVGETLRVNGKASIVIAPDMLKRFAVDGREPKCVISIAVDTVFFQCGRAILRSKLWDLPSAGKRPDTVPSAGTILAALSEGHIDRETYDRAAPARQLDTLY